MAYRREEERARPPISQAGAPCFPTARFDFAVSSEGILSETRAFSLILLLAALAVGIGASLLVRMIVRDIIERSREDEARDVGWFE